MEGPAFGINLTPLKLTNSNASFCWETYTALGLSLNLELIILSKLTDQQIPWSSCLCLPGSEVGGIKAPCRKRVFFLLYCFTPSRPSMLPESKDIQLIFTVDSLGRCVWRHAEALLMVLWWWLELTIPWLLWGAQGMNHSCDITEYVGITSRRVTISQSMDNAQINSGQLCFTGWR